MKAIGELGGHESTTALAMFAEQRGVRTLAFLKEITTSGPIGKVAVSDKSAALLRALPG